MIVFSNASDKLYCWSRTYYACVDPTMRSAAVLLFHDLRIPILSASSSVLCGIPCHGSSMPRSAHHDGWRTAWPSTGRVPRFQSSNMSSLIGSVGPNSIVSTNQVLPTWTSDGDMILASVGTSFPVALNSGISGVPSTRGIRCPPAACHEMYPGGWTRWKS
jgi:hypothetical protein